MGIIQMKFSEFINESYSEPLPATFGDLMKEHLTQYDLLKKLALDNKMSSQNFKKIMQLKPDYSLYKDNAYPSTLCREFNDAAPVALVLFKVENSEFRYNLYLKSLAPFGIKNIRLNTMNSVQYTDVLDDVGQNRELYRWALYI
jgi:hypothetical protein